MKINVEVDLTPEEMRRLMGLPDVQVFHEQMLESFSENLQSSQEQRDEFMRNMFVNSMAPWQNFFALMAGASQSSDNSSNK